MKKNYKAIIAKTARGMALNDDDPRSPGGPLNDQIMRRLPGLGVNPNSASGERLGNGWEVTFVIEDLDRWQGALGSLGGINRSDPRLHRGYAGDDETNDKYYNDEAAGTLEHPGG